MNLTVARTVQVDPAVVWELLVDTSRWPEWGPSVSDVDLPGGRIGPGAAGRVRTAVGMWLPFRVSEFHDGRSWSWRVAGIAATTHGIDPVPGGCRVTFGTPIAAAPYALVCSEALRRIERIAHHDTLRTEETHRAHDH